MLKHSLIKPGMDEIFGTDDVERFHVTSSKKNADLITINDFEYGADLLHYGKVNSTGYQFEWIETGGDGEFNDLLITMGNQKVVLSDLLDQLDDPVEYRFFQGFEDNADDIFDSDDFAGFGTATRVASGTGGIDSADGDFHAIFEQDSSGPFTRFGGYEDDWIGEWTASVDIFLDSTADGGGWAAGDGFDYSVAANGSDGNHQRDFIFHVTQDSSTGDLLINADNNTNFAPREDLETLTGTATVAADGWYTFEHRFYDDGGVLAADMRVLDESGSEIFSTTRSDATDLIATEIGGNRYGWFTTIEVADGIAVDNLSLAYSVEQMTALPDPDQIFFV